MMLDNFIPWFSLMKSRSHLMKSIGFSISRNNEPFHVHQDGATNLICTVIGLYIRCSLRLARGHENLIVNPELW